MKQICDIDLDQLELISEYVTKAKVDLPTGIIDWRSYLDTVSINMYKERKQLMGSVDDEWMIWLYNKSERIGDFIKPDSIEEQIESDAAINKWSFSSAVSHSGSPTYPTKQAKLSGEPKINVNNASKGELMRLPGIGDKLSDKIIAYRSVYGGFRTIDDLQSVKGIGVKTVAKLKPYATVYD